MRNVPGFARPTPPTSRLRSGIGFCFARRLLQRRHVLADHRVQQRRRVVPVRLGGLAELRVRPVRRPVPVPTERHRPAVHRVQDGLLRVPGLQVVRLPVGGHVRDQHRRVHLPASRGRQELRPVRPDDVRLRPDHRLRGVQLRPLGRGQRQPAVRPVQRVLRVIRFASCPLPPPFLLYWFYICFLRLSRPVAAPSDGHPGGGGGDERHQ